MERISLRGGAKELRELLDVLSQSSFCPARVYPDDLNLDTETCPTEETSPAQAKKSAADVGVGNWCPRL